MGNPWLIATATPATSSIAGRHMVCSSSYYSCATSIITGQRGWFPDGCLQVGHH
ncbi:hypothetical protein OIU77_017041 [Salix suchowensis]|uniref:Uncharacterized protein n=1 Tax=Salix suchowensis TaxID=1278906 RepID=A0ABQ8ZMR8_9ROSI|nr:hypothetical protein OIU77_017041 [Salix suchowensis]